MSILPLEGINKHLINSILFLIKKSRNNILAFLAYSILSIIFTYPVAFSSKEIPGGCDAFQFLWTFWWFKKTLLSFANPYYTTYMFYPNGVNLAFTELTPVNSIASIPLQQLFDLVETYNILWIFSFILSGYGAFLLARYIIGDSRAALVSGIIFAFCPYHFAHALGHLNLTTTEWIPFFVLFFIKTLTEEKNSNAICAAFFLLLVTLSSYYYLIYLSIFSLLYLFYYFAFEQKSLLQGKAKRLTLMLASFVIISLPFLYPLLNELLTTKSSYMYGGGFVGYSADFIGFFIPTALHPLFKEVVSPIYANFTGNIAENTVFIGYAVLLLSAVALFKSRTKEVKFWAVSALIFFVLSLGPLLHVNGIVTYRLGIIDLRVPLPYYILQYIPLFSLARVPSRWDVLVMLSASILSGFGLKFLFESLKTKSFCRIDSRSILTLIIASIVLFEFLTVPYPVASTKVPLFYQNIGKDSENYAILEFPVLWYAEPMYWQTIHGKRLIGGYASRLSEDDLKFIKSTPLISQLFNRSPELETWNHSQIESAVSTLNYYKIKYIVLYPGALKADDYNYYNSSLKRIVGDPLIFENGPTVVVYNIKANQTDKLSFFELSLPEGINEADLVVSIGKVQPR